LRDEVWFKQTLTNLGFTTEAIQAFTDQSKFKIEKAIVKAAEPSVRALTQAQIREMYRFGFIMAEQLPGEFAKLGYAQAEAKLLADLMVDVEAMAPKVLTLSQSAVIRLYEYKLLGLSDDDMLRVMRNIIAQEGPRSPTAALYDEYLRFGYSVDDAVKVTIWTLIDTELPILRSQYSKGWITSISMFNRLMEIGIPKEHANTIMTTIVKAEQPSRVVAEKDLTKAEIIKGFKNEILLPTEAVSLLEGLGYDHTEALYLLAINTVVTAGDPQGYWEMRRVVELQKKAQGKRSVDIPEDLILLEAKVRAQKKELEMLNMENASDEAIGQAAVDLSALETNMRVVLAKLKLTA